MNNAIFLSIAILFIGIANGFSAEPARIQVTQVINPMTIQEAMNWDVYLETKSLDPSTAIGPIVSDTAQVKNGWLLIHSYSIYVVNEKPCITITYLKPKLSAIKAAKDMAQIEESIKRMMEIERKKDELAEMKNKKSDNK